METWRQQLREALLESRDEWQESQMPEIAYRMLVTYRQLSFLLGGEKPCTKLPEGAYQAGIAYAAEELAWLHTAAVRYPLQYMKLDPEEFREKCEGYMHRLHDFACAWDLCLELNYEVEGASHPQAQKHFEVIMNGYPELGRRLEERVSEPLLYHGAMALEEIRAELPHDCPACGWWYLRRGGMVDDAVATMTGSLAELN